MTLLRVLFLLQLMAKVLMSIYQHLPLSLATLIFPTNFWHQTKYISFKLEPQNLLPSLLIFLVLPTENYLCNAMRFERTYSNRYLLILDLKSFSHLADRSKESILQEENFRVQLYEEKTVDTGILITYRNGDRKIMHSIRIASGPLFRIRK